MVIYNYGPGGGALWGGAVVSEYYTLVGGEEDWLSSLYWTCRDGERILLIHSKTVEIKEGVENEEREREMSLSDQNKWEKRYKEGTE